MKTHELTGTDLNKAVAECLGIEHTRFQGQVVDQGGNPLMYDYDWSIAGEIIEREKIELFIRDEKWFAYSSLSTPEDFYGETPLIAAMRCYVASKQGEQND
jgi:hypothetical protein